MGLVTTLAVASLVVGAAGTVASIEQGNKSAKAQKEARATSQAQNSINQQAQIRDQVRAQRVKTAQISQASADTGVTGSSGELGSASVLGAQTGSNVGNISGAGITTESLSRSTQRAADANSRANTYGAIANIGMSSFNIFSNTPQFKQSYNSIFGS
jgi:hypothetical protein